MVFRAPDSFALRAKIAIFALASLFLTKNATGDVAAGPDVASSDKPAAAKFLRLLRDERGEPTTLQTSIARYVSRNNDTDLVVDLIGAVHIGDKQYYEQLNRRFEKYDVVLYELVAPEGTRIPLGGRRQTDNPLSMLQNMSKSMLGLQSQTEFIDYTKDNFVHADMSPQDIAEAMRKRGDTGLTLMLSIVSDVMRQANLQQRQSAQQDIEGSAEVADPLALLLDPQRGVKLKKIMAQQFEQLGAVDGALGPTLGRMLIDDRNAAAIKVLKREIAAGRKQIAIFYGAAHMPDFQQRLTTDFGLTLQRIQWLSAWDLTREGPGDDDDPLEAVRKLLLP